jgi:serine/threonine protein kinase
MRVISCAPGAHIGEQITLGFLKDRLKGSTGTILTNYHHPDVNATLEIDLVVVNHNGVWLLEVKHWWGRIIADPIHWLHAGHKELSPITSIENKAKVVHSTLDQAGMGNVSVVGLVVLSKGTATLEIHDPRAHRVFGLHDRLIEALTGRDYVFRPNCPILRQSQIDRIERILTQKHVDPEWKIMGSYRIVAELAPGEGYQAFEGQHVRVIGRRARLKRYHIPAIKSAKHLQESVRRFKQDMEALSQLEGHPNIVRAYDFMPDPDTDDTYWLLLELVDGKTLRNIIDEGRDILLAEQMRYLIPVADALAYCHEQGIIHRNLTPDAIYITEEGQVKLGDFDFARVPAVGQTISKTGQPLVQNRYTSPEQLSDARAVDYRTDIYSLGAVWYDLAFRPEQDAPVLVHLIDQAPLPDDARLLMRQMLSPRPSDRAASAADVREWFELLA